MKRKTRKKVWDIWTEVNHEFPDRSTPFLISQCVERLHALGMNWVNHDDVVSVIVDRKY
jgi:hypothetical protein